MNRKDYIEAVRTHFLNTFLVSVSKRDSLAIAALEKFLCKVEKDEVQLVVIFNLAKLFDALCWHASLYQISLPDEFDWNKDFQYFCRQIMNPWPDEAIKALGYKIELVGRGRGYANCEYKLSAGGSNGRIGAA